MTYSEFKFVIGKVYIPIDKLKFEIGDDNYNYCQTMPTGYKYALWYVLDDKNNYHLIYTNFKKEYPFFELPYIKPSINNALPL